MWEMLVSYWWLLACLAFFCWIVYRKRLKRQIGNSPIYVLKTASELMSLTDSGDIIWEYRIPNCCGTYNYYYCNPTPTKTVVICPPTFWRGIVLEMDVGKTSKNKTSEGVFTLPFEEGKELLQKVEHSIQFLERK